MRRLVLLILLLSGCATPTVLEYTNCSFPMISVAGECCMDTNNNSICDELEEEPEEEIEVTYLNYSQLEEDIQKAFRTKSFYFREDERENVTGIENTYELRSSLNEGISILKIKKEYNFMHSYANFSDFVTRLYDLSTKNTRMYGDSRVDDLELTTGGRYFYKDEHELEEIKLSERDVIYMRHIILFVKHIDNPINAWAPSSILIWCTPELVLEVVPTGPPSLGWFSGASEGTMKNIRRWQEKSKASLIEKAEQLITVCPQIE